MTQQVTIHAAPMGAFVGEMGAKKRYPGEFATCPSCGGRMHKEAELCRTCHNKERRNRARTVSKERRRRFDLALLAGWTLEDIYGEFDEEYDPDRDKLPTMEEIMPKLIKKWWDQ